MRYHSKTFGHVEWPWWHDAVIVGGVIVIAIALGWLV